MVLDVMFNLLLLVELVLQQQLCTLADALTSAKFSHSARVRQELCIQYVSYQNIGKATTRSLSNCPSCNSCENQLSCEL